MGLARFGRSCIVALAFFAAMAGCTEDPGAILIVIDAHPVVRERANELQFRAWGGSSATLSLTVEEPFRPDRWPVLAVLDPLDGDSSRRWAFEVGARDRAGEVYLVRRVRGTFHGGEVRRVDIYLEPPCIAQPGDDFALRCGDWYDRTCLGGSCMDTPEDEGQEWSGDDPRTSDGGMDARVPLEDAGIGDAGPDASDPCADCVAPDACSIATCIGGVCEIDPIDCDDANECTEDTCSAGVCAHDGAPLDTMTCASGTCCGGTCVATDRDPANCGTCSTTCGPPTPSCIGGSCGTCSVAGDCPTPRSCEMVACNSGSCDYTLQSSFCDIASMCVADGTPHPSNPCVRCDAARDTTDWSPSGSSVSCADEGLSCTDDLCATSGTTCEHTLRADTCLISGACRSSGEAHPGLPCDYCSPTSSTSGWTTHGDGERFVCGGPQTLCCSGVCVGTCTDGATEHCDGTIRPSNPCQRCNGPTNTWVSVTNGTTCTGGTCQSGTCAVGGCSSHGECSAGECCMDTVCVPEGGGPCDSVPRDGGTSPS